MKELLLLYCIFTLLKTSAPLIVEDTFNSVETFKYITRFCFLNTYGNVRYRIQFSSHHAGTFKLLFYPPSKWRSVYKKDLTCTNKTAVLNSQDNQVIPLNPSLNTFCKEGNGTIICDSTLNFEVRTRALWWYIAISNCDSPQGMGFHYQFWLQNDKTNIFAKHISADKLGIFETSIAFCLLYVMIFIIILVFAVMLHEKDLLHATYRLFMWSVFIRCLHLVIFIATWTSFAYTGGWPTITYYIGEFFQVASHILFLAMLLLTAVGYTIVIGKLPVWMVVVGTLFIASYVLSFAALFIAEIVTMDDGEVVYRYEGRPGTGIMVMRLIAWGFFLAGCIFNLVVHKKKRVFYSVFVLAFTVWFWAVPGLVWIAINHMEDYSRERVVTITEYVFIALGDIYYLVITRPVDANERFPFHITENKIDTVDMEAAVEQAIQEEEEERENRGCPELTNLDSFTHTGNGVIGSSTDNDNVRDWRHPRQPNGVRPNAQLEITDADADFREVSSDQNGRTSENRAGNSTASPRQSRQTERRQQQQRPSEEDTPGRSFTAPISAPQSPPSEITRQHLSALFATVHEEQSEAYEPPHYSQKDLDAMFTVG